MAINAAIDVSLVTLIKSMGILKTYNFFVYQLSPSLSPNPQRRVIEQFKKALFGPQSNAVNLKNEVKKVRGTITIPNLQLKYEHTFIALCWLLDSFNIQ